ncbi:MAG: hypothetical protein M3N98_06585 [Actinomycetota bacterium]|nr:hypothetical protein [Actinomycetota bacterium]
MSPNHDPTAALNEVLSEVIDVVQDVKQAHRKVPETHALHRVIDRLLDQLRNWAGLLMDQDEALGVSPLGMMTSVAGRTPPNLWLSAPEDVEVRRILVEHLDRLGQHAAAARAEQTDRASRAVLAAVQSGVSAYRQELSEL